MPLSLRSAAAALVLVTASATVRAAPPRDDLLRFVPDDVAFCLVVNDLRGHTATLASSPLFAAVRKSPIAEAVTDNREVQQLLQVRQHLNQLLGIDWEKLRDDVFGDAIVFAYRPGAPGKPDQEQGLMLVHARDPKALTDLVDRLNALQQASGELKGLEERQHEGIKYVCRLEKKQPTYYLTRGSVFVFSGQEAMLRQAIVTERGRNAADKPPLAARLHTGGADTALASLWVNPRAFDAELKAKAERAAGPEAAVLKQFAACWRSLEDVTVGLHVDRDLVVTLALRARAEQLPASVRGFLESAARPSDLWRHFPEDALVTIAGRWNFAALAEAIGGFLPEPARQTVREELNRTVGAALGREVMREVLPHVGPDWGICITAPPVREKSPLPRVVAAVRVAAGDGPEPVDRAVVSGLHALALMGVLAHNKHHPDRPLWLKTGKAELRYLHSERGLPPGVRPAFGLSRGYLVLASAPAAIETFASADPPGRLESPRTVPLLRASLVHWRTYLSERREPLAHLAAEQNGWTPAEATQRMDRLLAVLHWFERLDLGFTPADNAVTFTLRLRTDPPLKK